jgi:hypothetical protein
MSGSLLYDYVTISEIIESLSLICILSCIYLNNIFFKLGLQSWEDIDKLNSFPKLEEVRLLGIPLLQPYTTEERRKLVIARSVVLISSAFFCFIRGIRCCLRVMHYELTYLLTVFEEASSVYPSPG